MYPHMNIDDCRTCTSREMKLNTTKRRTDGRMDMAKL